MILDRAIFKTSYWWNRYNYPHSGEYFQEVYRGIFLKTCLRERELMRSDTQRIPRYQI